MAEIYSQYLNRIRIDLVKKCGRKRAETILSEAKSHLEEGIEELVSSGMTRLAAEEAMISRFGEATDVCAWYAEQHRRPSVWRASRLPLCAVTIATLFWIYQHDILPIEFLFHFGSVVILNLMLAATILVCFRSKRFVSGVFVLAGAGLYASTIAYFCVNDLPIRWEHGYGVIAKSEVKGTLHDAKGRIQRNTRMLTLLTGGKKAFESKSEPPGGVCEFRDSRGYLTPDYFLQIDPRVHVYLDDQPTSGIFSTYKEARNFWIDQPSRNLFSTGKKEIYYLADVEDELNADRDIVANLPTADKIPMSRRLPVFVDSAKYLSMFALGFGLIADIIGGILRLIVELIGRALRNRLSASRDLAT